MVEEALGIPVFLENDANLAALGEFHFANLTDNDTFIYITVSTGIGCGVIKNGKILTEDLFDTELGHYNVVVDGKFCPCGKMGCLELYSSGTAIANDVSVLLNKNCDTKTAFSLARAGEVRVLKIINTATDKLALAINKLCYELNPKYIVLGGGVTKDSDVFLPRLKEKVLHKCDIKISSLDGKQGMLGAVVFGIQNYEGKW